MRITLQVTDGPHKGRAFTFQGHDTFLVGRSRRAHLRLPAKDMYFSRVHFLVEINPPCCRLMDMGSRNGTQVNGQRVEETIDLKDGDQIKAGHTVFRLSLTEDSRVSVPPAVSVAPSAPSAVQGFPETLLTCEGKPPPSQPITHPPSASVTTQDHATPTQSATTVPSVTTTPGSLSPDTIPPSVPGSATSVPAPNVCRICGAACVEVPAALPTSAPHPLDGQLCSECLRRMNSLAQTVPGYRLLREIGRGGMGIVYLASRADGKFVAVKTITPAVPPSEIELQRFLREADILRQLDHPHIVRFLEISSNNDQLWFAMDFVPGFDAGRVLKKEGPLAIPRAVGLICQLLMALEHAHARGFVHRDIKPANLLVTKRNGRETVVLADFGLARVYHGSQLSGLTMTGAVGGTPMFMAPEQITHYRDARPPVDQYAAAMTLYNLLTGQHGFDAPDDLKRWIALLLEEEPVPIRKRRPEIPQELADVIHKALQKEAKDRFADVRALRKALHKFAR